MQLNIWYLGTRECTVFKKRWISCGTVLFKSKLPLSREMRWLHKVIIYGVARASVFGFCFDFAFTPSPLKLTTCNKQWLNSVLLSSLGKFGILVLNYKCPNKCVFGNPKIIWTTYELSQMTLLFISSRSWVDRAPARCSGGHAFDSCWGFRFFLCPTLVSVDQLAFHKCVFVFFLWLYLWFSWISFSEIFQNFHSTLHPPGY